MRRNTADSARASSWGLLDHLTSAGGKFQVAPGVPGKAMSVFTLPSYDLVFKIFQDAFADRDDPDRQAIMHKYHLVAMYDRAGQSVNAKQIENLTFDRRYFADMLLTELARVATRTVIIESDHVIIKHAFVEPRLTSLDIYLREVDQTTASAAVVDYGNAIKDLAASNIFPGDLLLRNFGVTREGRVLLYDYDRLCLFTDCKVSQMPEARDDIEEFADEPWFYIAPNEFFPEEFRTFLGLPAALRETFISQHADLFEVDFWLRTQRSLAAGETIDLVPHKNSRQLR